MDKTNGWIIGIYNCGRGKFAVARLWTGAILRKRMAILYPEREWHAKGNRIGSGASLPEDGHQFCPSSCHNGEIHLSVPVLPSL